MGVSSVRLLCHRLWCRGPSRSLLPAPSRGVFAASGDSSGAQHSATVHVSPEHKESGTGSGATSHKHIVRPWPMPRMAPASTGVHSREAWSVRGTLKLVLLNAVSSAVAGSPQGLMRTPQLTCSQARGAGAGTQHSDTSCTRCRYS